MIPKRLKMTKYFWCRGDVAWGIYKKMADFVELLESSLGVSGITLHNQWTDPLDAWALIVDRSSGDVFETVVNIKGRT